MPSRSTSTVLALARANCRRPWLKKVYNVVTAHNDHKQCFELMIIGWAQGDSLRSGQFLTIKAAKAANIANAAKESAGGYVAMLAAFGEERVKPLLASAAQCSACPSR